MSIKVKLSGWERCINATAHHETVPWKDVSDLIKEYEDLRLKHKELENAYARLLGDLSGGVLDRS